jgi:hypothetical protein
MLVGSDILAGSCARERRGEGALAYLGSYLPDILTLFLLGGFAFQGRVFVCVKRRQ